MKYTVVILQPITDEVRPQLVKELVESFGLAQAQAEKLASRRTGRVLKPTSRDRAEHLQRVYESVGAQVQLEEVTDETQTMTFPVPAPETILKPKPAADPFAPDPFATMVGTGPADPLLSWSQPKDSSPSAPSRDGVFAVADQPDEAPLLLSETATHKEIAIAQELAQVATNVTTGAHSMPADKPSDDWMDFAGGLKLPENSPAPEPRKSTTATTSTTEFVTAVGATATSIKSETPKTSIVKQILMGTLVPLGISSALGLLLLSVVLPIAQKDILKQDARNIATTIASGMGNASRNPVATDLDNIIANTKIGFVQVGTPTGGTFTRSVKSANNEQVNNKINQWLAKNPDGGSITIDGRDYMASRVSVVSDGKGGFKVVDAKAKSGTIVRRVTVGVPTSQVSSVLTLTLVLTLISSLVGVGIGAYLAYQAAQRIVKPLANLVEITNAISLGDLNRVVRPESNDEIGELAQSLERMRLSLVKAMDRLRSRKMSR